MAVNLDEIVIALIVSSVVLAPFLWVSGRILVGKRKVKFSDAVWIVVLGVLIGGVIGYLFVGILASLASLIVWLGLIKHFFGCGWLKALAVAVLSMVIFVLVAALMGSLGYVVWSWL